MLHNVGNVLNSLDVSASLIATGLRHFKAGVERDLGNRWHFFLDNRWGWAAGAVGLGNYSDFVCGILA